MVWARSAATQDGTIETYLSAIWDEHCQEAWFLISDQPAGKRRVKEYAWRMRKDRHLSG